LHVVVTIDPTHLFHEVNLAFEVRAKGWYRDNEILLGPPVDVTAESFENLRASATIDISRKESACSLGAQRQDLGHHRHWVVIDRAVVDCATCDLD
jgi:hypothetical protein